MAPRSRTGGERARRGARGATTHRSQVVRTAAGRAVDVHEFGDPHGEPVVALHGTPACGVGFDWLDGPARERGMRVVAPDRPGVGRSEPVPMRCVADYAVELAAVVDVLGLDRFTLLGYSGGGPYALAVAAAASPGRIASVQLAAPAGQIGVWATLDDLDRTDRQLTWLSLHAPMVARAEMRVAGALARRAPRFSRWWLATGLPASDKQLMRELGAAASLALFTEAITNGTAGVVDDYALLSKPWGVDVGAVRVPVDCWHGTADTMVPIGHTRALVEHLPDARLTTWPGEGHLGVVRHAPEILDTITARSHP